MLRYLPSLLLLAAILFHPELEAQKSYFPPLTGSLWEKSDPGSLGWCTDQIQALYDYLDAEETKAFIVLKDGRIVLEKYFDSFTADSLWYWASAGKTLTAFLVGIAQQEGKLKLQDPSSKFLGQGWTTAPADKESAITIRHQLTMSSGLDDGVADNHCTQPDCLLYKADAGQRWAYHNAPYTLLRDVLENATGINENQYIQSRLKARTGMNGFWFNSGFDNVYASTPRSMARFGLLIQNRGIWNQDSLLRDQRYWEQMVTSSQDINKSYGYLWWLNGKSSFMVPGLQLVFPGSYAPEAPADMYAGIGKNGQLLCIAPSLGLVVVRMGEAGGTGRDEVSLILCNQIWKQLNQILCVTTGTSSTTTTTGALECYPNPASTWIQFRVPEALSPYKTQIFNHLGQLVREEGYRETLDIRDLEGPFCYLRVFHETGSLSATVRLLSGR